MKGKGEGKVKGEGKGGVLVTVIGDITLDLVSSPLKKRPEEDTEIGVEFTAKLGGQAAHCALGLAKRGARARFVSCVGRDVVGDFVVGRLRKENNLELKLRRKGKTALSVIIPTNHRRTIFNEAGANALFSRFSLDELEGRYLFIGGFWHLRKLDVLRILKAAKKRRMTTFLDVGYQAEPDRKKLFRALKQVDYCFLDKKELLLYTGERSFSLALKKIPQNCALGLHRGEKGSGFYGKSGKSGKRGESGESGRKILLEVPVKKVYDGETTGAGDFWNAGFVYGIIQQWEIRKILKFANEFAVKCLEEGVHHL